MSVKRYVNMIYLQMMSMKKILIGIYGASIAIVLMHIWYQYKTGGYFTNLKYAYMNCQILIPILYSVPVIATAYIMIEKKGAALLYIGRKNKLLLYLTVHTINMIILIVPYLLFYIIFPEYVIWMYLKTYIISLFLFSVTYASMHIIKHIEVPIIMCIGYSVVGLRMMNANSEIISAEVDTGMELLGHCSGMLAVIAVLIIVGVIFNNRIQINE